MFGGLSPFVWSLCFVACCSDVAVTGLPDPQDDHAMIMAGFALECRKLMRDVCRRLERSLGPDTGDLCMRIGLHSGPVSLVSSMGLSFTDLSNHISHPHNTFVAAVQQVTAGVLRGEKSRFQLFGDVSLSLSALTIILQILVARISHKSLRNIPLSDCQHGC